MGVFQLKRYLGSPAFGDGLMSFCSRVDLRMRKRLPALVLVVDDVGVVRIHEGPEAVSAGEGVPVLVLDGPGPAGGAVPRRVVLEAAVDVVRPVHVVAHVVELRDGQASHEAPLRPAVVGDVDAAVRAHDQVVRVPGIHPQRVDVGVGAPADVREGLPAVLAQVEAEARLVDSPPVPGVGHEVGEVEGPGQDRARGARPLPALPEVVGAVDRALLRLDGGVDDARARRRDGERDPPELALGQAPRHLPPGLSPVRRLVERGAGATGGEEVRIPPELPHPRVDDPAVLGVDGEVRAAGVSVDEEGLLPGLPAVGRAEDAALRVGVEGVAGGAGEDGVRVGGIDHDLGDPLGVGEAHLLPALAPVGRLVEPVAHGDGVADAGLAGADPDRLRVLRVDGDGPDRLAVLVEDGLEGEPPVHGLPETAARGPHPDGEPVSGHRVDRRDAAAHGRGADRAGFDAAEGVGVDLHVLAPDGKDGRQLPRPQESEEQEPPGAHG